MQSKIETKKGLIRIPFFFDTKDHTEDELIKMIDLIESKIGVGFFLNSRETTEVVLFENHNEAAKKFSFDKSYLGVNYSYKNELHIRAYKDLSDIGCTVYNYADLVEKLESI